MEKFNLEDMVKGWFVGNFEPSSFKTSEFEVAIKKYAAGESETTHFHKIATEITVVVSGRVSMCGSDWGPGSIIKLSPGEETNFLAYEDTLTVVVKSPSVIGDKFNL